MRKSLVFLCLLSSLGWSQTEDMNELLDMSLAELLTVSIAATKAENIAHTPAIVSRYEAADMAHLGLETLQDMLSFIPGAVVNNTEIGTAAIMIRGLVEGFNQKVLFLLNGVPHWQPGHGDNAVLGIPFDAVERVEVIRGPGAVIYGTNATGGVVNVITKKSENPSVQGVVGSRNMHSISANLGGYWGKLGHLSLNFSSRRDGGYPGFYNTRNPPPFYPNDTPLEGTIDRYWEHDSLLLKYRGNKATVGLHVFGSDTSGLAAAASIVNEAELKYRGYQLYADYDFKKGRLEGKVFADYNNFYLSIPTESLFSGRHPGIQEFSDDGADNRRVRFGARFNVKINDHIQWLSGVETEEREIGTYGNTPLTPDFERVVTMEATKLDERGLYSQIDITRDKWRLLLGGRYVDNERSGSEFNPRISVIYKLNEQRSLKLLYSVGFNSPTFIQQGLQIPFVVAGDPDNRAELVRTLDFAYTHASDRQLFVVNAYRLEAEDFIRRIPNPNAPGTLFNNADNFSRHGLELDYQRALAQGRLFCNLAWQKEANEERANDGSALFAPALKVSVGGFYNLRKQHTLGSSLIWIGEREEADHQVLLSFKYTYRMKHWHLGLAANNLLGTELVTPDVGNFVPNRLSPGGDSDPNGRFTVTYQF